jgi:hypothetical protein
MAVDVDLAPLAEVASLRFLYYKTTIAPSATLWKEVTLCTRAYAVGSNYLHFFLHGRCLLSLLFMYLFNHISMDLGVFALCFG